MRSLGIHSYLAKWQGPSSLFICSAVDAGKVFAWQNGAWFLSPERAQRIALICSHLLDGL